MNSRRIIYTFSLLLITAVSVAGGIMTSQHPENRLQGQWVCMYDNKSLSFSDDGTLLIDDKYKADYSASENGRLTVEYGSRNIDFKYVIQDGLLTLNEGILQYEFCRKDNLDSFVNSRYA